MNLFIFTFIYMLLQLFQVEIDMEVDMSDYEDEQRENRGFSGVLDFSNSEFGDFYGFPSQARSQRFSGAAVGGGNGQPGSFIIDPSGGYDKFGGYNVRGFGENLVGGGFGTSRVQIRGNSIKSAIQGRTQMSPLAYSIWQQVFYSFFLNFMAKISQEKLSRQKKIKSIFLFQILFFHF